MKGQGGEKAGPSRYLYEMGKSVRLGSYPSYSTIKIKNLSIGITYEISTQDRSDTTATYPPYDTLLVLRDADGQVIISNNDCAYYVSNTGWDGKANSAPSYLVYTHTTALYDYVYVSIYHWVSDGGSGVFPCDVPVARGYSDLFIAAVYDRDDDFPDDFYCDTPNLICQSDIVSLTFADTFDEDNFLDYSNDDLRMCGANENDYQDLLFFYNDLPVQSIPTFYGDCDWIGEGKVRLQLFGSTCDSTLRLFPDLRCENNAKIQFPSSFLTYCSFDGTPCPINVRDYPPLVYNSPASLNCYPDPSVVSYDLEITSSSSFITIGSTVTFDIYPVISREQGEPATDCSVTYYGIQPSLLSRFDSSNFPNSIRNDDQIYFDTSYEIHYNASVGTGKGPTSDPISIVLISSGSRGDQDIFDNVFNIPYSIDYSCEEANDLMECESYSLFCIPSDLGIEEGYYQVGFVMTRPIISSPPSSSTSFNPVNPPPLDDKRRKVNQRNINNEDYVVSIGNPLVYLSNTDKPTNGEISCSKFNIGWVVPS